MFGRTGRRIDDLEKRVAMAEIRLQTEIDATDGMIDHDVHGLYASLNALASALGYEWVPEGKTAAKWEKKAADWLGPPVCGSCFKSNFDTISNVATKKGKRRGK